MPEEGRPHFLVVRLSSIGDLVHTLPAVAALRRRFPEARIDWLVETRYRDVLLDNPDVDELIEVDTLGWRRKLLSPRTWTQVRESVAAIRAHRYDAVLDLQGTIKSAVCAFLARSDRRIGFTSSHLKERAASLLYKERVAPNGIGPHVIDRHLGLLTVLNIHSDERAFPIVVPANMVKATERRLGEWHLEAYVILNPGGSWVTKLWSSEKFGQLAAAIQKEFQLPSLVIWGPGEKSMAECIVDTSSGAARLAPETSLREMIPYIERARLFVSGDTGPMHIASARGVPVVGIFGPTDPARNGPLGTRDEVVYHAEPCGPCYKHHCPGYGNVCMTKIELDEVLSAVRRQLAET
jgi:heptosyltransferase-1